MNYSILQSELDQETAAMEDMHMFFVAFNHRMNKIVNQVEKPDNLAKANDRSNLLYIDDDLRDDDTQKGDKSSMSEMKKDVFGVKPKGLHHNNDADNMKVLATNQPMNVILLKNEVDLE